MALRKCFKWTEETYDMREFIDTFSHRLPVVIYIVVGWMGRDEEHEFSGDQMYRINSIKRQRRVVTRHNNGYFVSIPTRTNRKVDLLITGKPERRSVTVKDVAKAFHDNIKGCVSMMFEKDTKLSFTYGPDYGAEINFGKMEVVDVYEERYLVAHSIINGNVYAPRTPVAIPVYMNIDVSPIVRLEGGTKEDFNKAMADLDDQMKNGVTDVDIMFDEIMLFPEHIPDSDYEFIDPMATISRATTWKTSANNMTPSPAYFKCPPKKREPNVNVERSQGMYKQVAQRPAPRWDRISPHTHTSTKGPKEANPMLQAIVSPTQRPQQPASPWSPVGSHPHTSTKTPEVEYAALQASMSPTQRPQQMVSLPCDSTVAGRHDRSLPRTDNTYASQNKAWEHPPRGDASMTSTGPQQFRSFKDVPSDIRGLNCEQLARCLRLLKISEPCVEAIRDADVNGDLLMRIDESILTDEFHFRKFDAMKVMKFALHGYRPKFT